MRKILTTMMMAGACAIPSPAQGHFFKGCQKNPCKKHVIKPFKDRLARMHYCEARGVGWFRNGFFDGGLQFSPRTWNATGSKYSFAYTAPVVEQQYRAVVWASMIGWAWRSTAGWPNCG